MGDMYENELVQDLVPSLVSWNVAFAFWRLWRETG